MTFSVKTMLLLITTATSILSSSLEVNGLSSIASKAPIAAPNGVGDIGSAAKELFGEVIHSIRNANIFQAPVRQEGVKLYVATDGEFCTKRPGNGGIRLLNYDSDNDAINDAVRLAEGMTKKHDMFRTGFSGAKLVVNTDIPLEEIERKSLMEDVAVALEALCGKMYTGCDLNTCDIDMDYLTEATNEKYVLAGRESKVDTNVATAASVIGTVLGLVESHFMDLSDLTFTVQGCGKVGSVVAKELVRLGAKRVQTCDVRQGAAQIDGCIEIEDWTKANCDFLIPCANSLAITEVVAKNFPDGIKFCAGATNSPFSSQISKDIFANDRGVFHVPESVSSAGAVLADSVEFSHLDLYRTVEPALLYGWIRNLSRKKASDIVELASKNAAKMEASSKDVVPPRAGDPVGARFPQWIEDNTLKTQTLIVGGGMAGTATAFSLSERYNTKSVLVEAGSTVSPPEGSSNGDSRMYRKMYTDEFFSKMQAAALDRWRDVEAESGEILLQQNGLLFYGEDTGETVEGSVMGAKRTMEKLGLKHKFYEDGSIISKAYPALKGCDGKAYSAVYEEEAGHIRASKACATMAKIATDKGLCDVLTKTRISSLDIEGEGQGDDSKVTATTVDGLTIKADSVVICAGPWTNEVLEIANLPRLDLEVWEVQWGHYRVKKSDAKSIPQAFHFRKKTCAVDGGLYYVFPVSATESLADDEEYTYVKVGVDFPTERGGLIDGMKSFDYKGSERVLQLMDDWVKEHLPDCEERVDSYTSPYTMSSDSYFVLDSVHENVALFAGGSGRAFKFGPLIGDCLGSIVTGNEPPIDLEKFSASRDAVILHRRENEIVMRSKIESFARPERELLQV